MLGLNFLCPACAGLKRVFAYAPAGVSLLLRKLTVNCTFTPSSKRYDTEFTKCLPFLVDRTEWKKSIHAKLEPPSGHYLKC